MDRIPEWLKWAVNYEIFLPCATPESCLVTGKLSVNGTEHSCSFNGHNVPALEHNPLYTHLIIKLLQCVARWQEEQVKAVRGTVSSRVSGDEQVWEGRVEDKHR